MGKLEPAGVTLEAKGFKEYLNRLDRVEKKNREVFDQEFKGTTKSFKEVTRAAKIYEQQIENARKEQERFRREQEKSRIEQKKLATAQKQQRQIATASAIAGGAVIGREAIQFAKESINLAREQARVEAQLATAIQSTGGAAGLSSRELRNLASELQNTTNFGDEATIAAESLLLTFTNIGSDVFPETVRLTQDLATAMNKDLSSAALQVGKALNDPVAGLASLKEASIQFTPEQQAQVKNFVEINDLASAQGIILAELSRQFGGSAEAAREADNGIIALGNSFSDLQEQVGFLLLDLGETSNLTRETTGFFDSLSASIKGFRAEIGQGDTSDAITGLQQQISGLEKARDQLAAGGTFSDQFLETIGLVDTAKEAERLNGIIAELNQELQGLEIQAVAEDTEELARAQENAVNSTAALGNELSENLAPALRQAEQLQLSFARAAEDSARRQGRQVEKLRKTQEKERDKFLADQIKEFDKFNADLLKDIQSAQTKLNEARLSGNDDRLREQAKLHRDLRQAQDRFNLSQAQSERRFQLSDRRLRAEGDILALQELRENRGLEKLEDKENFELQRDQQKDDGKEQQKERDRQRRETVQALERDLADLQNSFGEQQAAFLADQDEEFRLLLVKQQEQRDAQQLAFREQAEDRRINQARQLEDLGRSLADQEDLTEQGAKDIAAQIEKVFGIDGIADTIFAGFSARTESEFRNLFATVSGIARNAGSLLGGGASRSSPRGGGRDRPLQFQEGGVVPGPVGAPVAAVIHGGETVIPATHQMVAPVIPSQNVNVSMSGGFNITGGEQAGEASVQMAVDEMTSSFEIAVRRLIRKG